VVLEITCRKVQNAIVKLERRRDLIIPGVFPGPEPPATAGWQNPKTNQHSKTTGPAGPRDHLSRRDSVAKRSKDRTQQAAIRRGGRSKNKVKNTGKDDYGPTWAHEWPIKLALLGYAGRPYHVVKPLP